MDKESIALLKGKDKIIALLTADNQNMAAAYEKLKAEFEEYKAQVTLQKFITSKDIEALLGTNDRIWKLMEMQTSTNKSIYGLIKELSALTTDRLSAYKYVLELYRNRNIFARIRNKYIKVKESWQE